MGLIQELGQRIEKYQKMLFNMGYSYDDAVQMVRIVFEESGLKFMNFFELDKEDLKKSIIHLDNSFKNYEK